MARRSPLERIETLTARISAIETERERAIASAVTGGSTWAQIGRALGVSAQAAHKRYRWLRHSPTTGETWHEPPLPV
jgi:transposase-like protein